ncbi:UDP-3-O-(3-hydroxymyristoyl)glucosamine N-acyltransferase [Kamptonema cortianum]|nr:UDP-3-O-(3-hydroxymyristoyl)glucosamine N-acyltransferase [Kamptonema cortianum]MDL5046067.1 UDP-3-O-(3-hydroxymyristoyl)glucosamine N-acyltransferase [Oscillatoria amoena NRMC-F 0135]MDL5052774.1 UDP-3-O-(3-hydroxymyristoyl)glucosamine N-acyltransferase [Oscillatoria laete-virens NRMC-F 0139]
MDVTLEQIARLVPGEVVGNYSGEVTGVNSLKAATPSELSFFANQKYVAQVEASQAAIILVPANHSGHPRSGQAHIRTANPSLSFAQVAALFAPPEVVYEPGVHPSAVIHPTAQIAPEASLQPHAVVAEGAVIGAGTVIGANCFVGPFSRVGKNCLIHANVSICARSLIGDHVTLHSGVVVGSDGFGFDLDSGNTKIPQTGIVQIDDHVEIGANTTIDRARFGRTWIQSGVKIDNLVQIAHNVVIKKNAIIVAQVGVSGSTVVGERAILAGQVGTVGHIEIGDGAIVAAKSGVSKDIPPKQIWSSQLHARDMKEFYAMEAALARLPELRRKIAEMEKRIKALES